MRASSTSGMPSGVSAPSDRPLEIANREIRRSSLGRLHRGQAGRFVVFTVREKKLNTAWQSTQ
jgi:hypothetical protein